MKKLIGSMLISLCTMHSAYAFNLSFLDYSPVYYYTQDDWKMVEAAILKALNNNVKVNWKNPKTNANGYIVPLKTFTQNGTICRQIKTYSQAHGYTGQSTYVFCKMRGDWKISP